MIYDYTLSNESPEEIEQRMLHKEYSVLEPMKHYYQKHNRYNEINISGKTEEEVLKEVSQVIDGIGQG